jgi:hypothetical protein
MGNTLKVALVQEVGNRTTQRIAFGAFNEALREDASRVARVLGDMFVGKPVEATDQAVLGVVDTVLTETNNGSQLGLGSEDEAKKMTPTLGSGEWAWGEVFADAEHTKARHEYGSLALQLQVAEREATQVDNADGDSNEALLVLAETTEAAKRQRALAALRVVATLNAVEQVATSEADEASLSAIVPVARQEAAPLAAVA